MHCVCGSTSHATRISRDCPLNLKNSPLSLISSQINLLDLLKSSPNKRKKDDTNKASNKRLNFDVTHLNSGPNIIEASKINKANQKQCTHCLLFGHQQIRHHACLKNPSRDIIIDNQTATNILEINSISSKNNNDNTQSDNIEINIQPNQINEVINIFFYSNYRGIL